MITKYKNTERSTKKPPKFQESKPSLSPAQKRINNVDTDRPKEPSTIDMAPPSTVYQTYNLPLLEVDINITPENSKRIQIYENDQVEGPNGVAHRFCI